MLVEFMSPQSLIATAIGLPVGVHIADESGIAVLSKDGSDLGTLSARVAVLFVGGVTARISASILPIWSL